MMIDIFLLGLIRSPRRLLIIYTTYSCVMIPAELFLLCILLYHYTIPEGQEFIKTIIQIASITLWAIHPFLLMGYIIYMWKSLKEYSIWRFPGLISCIILFYPVILLQIYLYLYIPIESK